MKFRIQKKPQSGNLVFREKWDDLQWAGFVYCHIIIIIIISARPLYRRRYQNCFWIYYGLIQSMGSSGFLLFMFRKENGRSKRAQ